MLRLVLCRGPQAWHEIARHLDRQTRTNCTDVQLNIMVVSMLQSKEVNQASYLIEKNSICLFYLYKFKDTDIHTYKKGHRV